MAKCFWTVDLLLRSQVRARFQLLRHISQPGVALPRDASWVDKTGRWDVQVWTAGSNHAQTQKSITSIEDKTCWTWILIGIHYGIHGKPCTWCSFLSSWEHTKGFAVLGTLDNPIEGIRIIWVQWEFHIFILLNLALVLSRLSPRWCDPSRALASRMSRSTWEGRRGCCLTLRPSPWQWGSCGGKFLHWTNNSYPLHDPLISEPEHVFLWYFWGLLPRPCKELWRESCDKSGHLRVGVLLAFNEAEGIGAWSTDLYNPL